MIATATPAGAAGEKERPPVATAESRLVRANLIDFAGSRLGRTHDGGGLAASSLLSQWQDA